MFKTRLISGIVLVLAGAVTYHSRRLCCLLTVLGVVSLIGTA